MVKQTLQTYRDLSCKLFCQYKADKIGHSKAKRKALMEAAMLMRRKHQWENIQKQVGHVEGIEVGDQFQYWTELNIIGLHHQFTRGIDYVGKDENSLATSIVVTNRYANVMKSVGCLVYIGHGGNPNVSNVLPRDQKLEGGNLALRNSMNARSPVRVILKVYRKSDGMDIQSNICGNYSYIYDGLYLVDHMTQERGQFGKLVFKFTMNRILDQPMCVSPKDVVMQGQLVSFTPRKRHKPKGHVARKNVVRRNDVSEGKEKFPIRVVTPIDCVQMPPPFDYQVNMVYPKKFKKCSSSCINRASQCGVQFHLEIFKTEVKGWGVRTRSFIPSGSCVCEVIGEFHHEKAGPRVDDYVFDLGAGNGFIDATRHGNVARFINHSCSPNLDVKDIIYDHNDESHPRKMLFALKNIPAGRELSYNYNCCKGKVIKVGNNNCYCGSQECNGKIYI